MKMESVLTTFDGRLEYDHELKFAPLPIGGNLVVGVTEHDTLYLCRGYEWRDENSRRMTVDVEHVGVLLITNVGPSKRLVRTFSPTGAVANDQVHGLLEELHVNANNSVWRVIPEEEVPQPAWLKLKNAFYAARDEFSFNQLVETFRSRGRITEERFSEA
jgi:hypothetical protein